MIPRPRIRFRWLRCKFRRLFNPVCQDFGATLYTMYRGKPVSLIPVVDLYDPTLIVDWIPAPGQMDAVNRILAAAATGTADNHAVPTSQTSRPPTLPAVNPAAVAGL